MRLQGVIAQYQCLDIGGKTIERMISSGDIERTGIDFGIQPYLDVDFMIGAIDTGRIVDGIGKDPTARKRKFDATGLRSAEIAPLRDDLAT